MLRTKLSSRVPHRMNPPPPSFFLWCWKLTQGLAYQLSALPLGYTPALSPLWRKTWKQAMCPEVIWLMPGSAEIEAKLPLASYKTASCWHASFGENYVKITNLSTEQVREGVGVSIIPQAEQAPPVFYGRKQELTMITFGSRPAPVATPPFGTVRMSFNDSGYEAGVADCRKSRTVKVTLMPAPSSLHLP